MNSLIKFTIKNFIPIVMLPFIILFVLNYNTPFYINYIIFIYGMLLYGFGRAVGQGMYFQTKQNKPIPQSLIDTIKSAKYHTFTIVQAVGAFLQAVNIYFSDIHLTVFIYMICTSFIFYYFAYARVYNYIRGRQWYNEKSKYQVMLCGKVRWFPYPSKRLSLVLTILSGLGVILFYI